MFEKYYASELIEKVLVSQGEYHPYPRCGEENTLTPAQKAHMVEEGEKFLNYEWPVAPAMAYMQYVKAGTRVPYEMTNYAYRRNAFCALCGAEFAENKGRFIPDIINGMWAIMDEATWVVPAHNSSPHFEGNKDLPDFDYPVIIDLFSAGTSGMLSNAYYLFAAQIDEVSPLVRRRFERVMEERIFTPFMQELYWWSGMLDRKTNNWDPWILSNMLTDFGLVCKDEKRRAAAVSRCLMMLDKFLDVYHSDGGCDEGPSYWGAAGAAFFNCLSEVSQLTSCALDGYFEEPLVKNIGQYIYRAHIGRQYFTNYADAPLKTLPDAGVIYRYGEKIHDCDMMDMGAALFQQSMHAKNGEFFFGIGAHQIYSAMMDINLYAKLTKLPQAQFPLLKEVYLDGIEMTAQRPEKGVDTGLYLSAKGGNNDESHNHNDIGSFIVYSDSVPAIVDIGSGLYNAKTFSARRYEIMQMQSNYHNLPIVNGCGELAGEQYAAKNAAYKTCDCGASVFSLDIAKAYDPKAGLEALQRTFVYDRKNKKIDVIDELSFAGEDNTVQFVFMVPVKPEICAGTVKISPEGCTPVTLGFDCALTAQVEEISTTHDSGLQRNWGDRIYRVLLTGKFAKTGKTSFTIAQANA